MQVKYLIALLAAVPLAFANNCTNVDGVSTSKYPAGCTGCIGPTSTVYAATFTSTKSVDCAGCTSVTLLLTGPRCLIKCAVPTITHHVGRITETTVLGCSATPY